MQGIIRLLRGRTQRAASSIAFYSKEGAKNQMNFWLDQYEDATIQIYPYPKDVELPEMWKESEIDPPKIDPPKKVEKPMGRWYQKCYEK